MIALRSLVILLCALTFQAFVQPSGALPAPGQTWVYQLVDRSFLINDRCPICEPPIVPQVMRGSFKLRFLDETPISVRYQISELVFTAPSNGGEDVITGSGTFTVSGQLVVRQQMVLNTHVNGVARVFTNEITSPLRRFPLLELELQQSESTPTNIYSLQLVAAPFREVWFSVVNGFTSGTGKPNGKAGDLIAATGRIVKSNEELVAQLGFQPGPGGLDHPVDAVDVAAGGEILFSFDQTEFSETMGSLQHGDLVSDRGRRLFLNQQLVSAFGLQSDAIDYGLDAVSVADDGEVFFSITTNVITPQPGITLHRGDLLSNKGMVIKSNQQLLSQFHPVTAGDYGLDAVYLWPSGEIWFSTEQGFVDQQWGSVQAGDLLSDQGIVIYRNLELVSAFAPVEDLSDFGLDALYIVTDTTAASMAPRFTRIAKENAGIHLRWTGNGRVFQLEASPQVDGPFEALGFPQTATIYLDTNESPTGRKFYRLIQW